MPELREGSEGTDGTAGERGEGVRSVHGVSRPRLPGYDEVKKRILAIQGFATCQRCREEIDSALMSEHDCG